MSTAADLCQRLEWDSTFFGISIARAVPAHVDPATCNTVLDWCRAQQIDCLYFLADKENHETRRVLEDRAFVHVDDRITFALDPVSPVAAPPTDTRAVLPADVGALREIAASAHRDSRFYNDGHFDRARCDELYRLWIDKSCSGWADHVVVAERDGMAIGYLTVHLRDPEEAAIGLVGVHPSFRRQGVGGHLLRSALAWIDRQSVKRVSVVTQGRNVASQGLYRNAGFRLTSHALWYHRWFSPLRNSTHDVSHPVQPANTAP
jgi:dTDP-4-amino-4,6-dideoxy-D-galactose acyltransferase